jgi:bacteriorhodopsin
VFLEAVVVVVCLCMLVFYVQKRRMKQCGVEVIFVCCMEMFCHMVNIIVGEDQLITMDDGRTVNWLRYSSWLITTPVGPCVCVQP